MDNCALEKLLELVEENSKWISSPIFELEEQSSCLHKKCPECNGTGVKKTGGACFHFISCQCPKCNPTF